MAFFEAQFPPDISRDMEGGPRFLTSKAYMAGGQRITNRMAAYPLHDFSLSQPPRTGALFEQLRAFFWVVGGDADAFRFKDWSDYIATQANTSATLITPGVYQLNRIYIFGARTFTRPIYKPVTGALVFRTRAVVVTDITGTTAVDNATGQITVTGHTAGDTYTWAGQFDIPAAFKDPGAMFRVLGGQQMLTEWSGIGIEEVRL
jgi:uncharacterized protein (TIGR02217 family)